MSSGLLLEDFRDEFERRSGASDRPGRGL